MGGGSAPSTVAYRSTPSLLPLHPALLLSCGRSPRESRLHIEMCPPNAEQLSLEEGLPDALHDRRRQRVGCRRCQRHGERRGERGGRSPPAGTSPERVVAAADTLPAAPRVMRSEKVRTTTARQLHRNLSRAIGIHTGHVRSESQSTQYVPLDIWTTCKKRIKDHSWKPGHKLKLGPPKNNCNNIDKYL